MGSTNNVLNSESLREKEAVDHDEYIRGKVIELSWVQLTIHAVKVTIGR